MFYTQDINIQFVVQNKDDIFHILSFEVEEKISAPLVCKVNAYCTLTTQEKSSDYSTNSADSSSNDKESLLNTPAMLICKAGSEQRIFSGIILEIEYHDIFKDSANNTIQSFTFYLFSNVSTLLFSEHTRVFQHPNIINIITDILTSHQIEFENKIYTADIIPSSTPYIQYEESDFIFIENLMREAGLYFVHDLKNPQKIVLMSSNSEARICYKEPLSFKESLTGQDLPLNYVWSLRKKRKVISQKYALQSYNPYQPSKPFSAHLETKEHSYLESQGTIQRFKRNLRSIDATEKEVSKLIIENEVQHENFDILTTALFLQSGSCFSMIHSASYDSIQYFITEITHKYVKRPLSTLPLTFKGNVIQLEGIQNEEPSYLYENTVKAIKSDTPFIKNSYSKNVSVKENLLFNHNFSGLHTALVVAPDGSLTNKGHPCQIDTLGRVPVRFFFQTAKSNRTLGSESMVCWTALSQSWAGASLGLFTRPRIGMEVVVAFFKNSQTEPLVMNYLHNIENQPKEEIINAPWLTSLMTQSLAFNGSYNELRFSDEANNENIILHAARNHELFTGQNYKLDVIGQRETTVYQGNETLLIKKGDCLVTLEKGDLKTSVEKGDYNIQINKGEYILSLTKGGLHIEAKDAINITSKSDLNLNAEGTLDINAETLKLKANSITLKGNDITLKAETSMSLKTGSLEIKAASVMRITAGINIYMDFPGKTPAFPMKP